MKSSNAAFDASQRSAHRILIFTDYFHPAFRAGGAVRALVASVRALDERFCQWIITRNHDLGNRQPYPFLDATELPSRGETWHPFGNANVWYTASVWSTVARLPALLRRTRPHLLYLNSVFSPLTRGVLLWRRIGVGARIPVLLAPRGELAPAALGIKGTRKRLWMAVARAMGLLVNVHWQASSAIEAAEVRSLLDRWKLGGKVVLIPEIVAVPEAPVGAKRTKASGSIRLCILGRVAPNKNIDGILRALVSAQGEYLVEVIGPTDDAPYVAACKALEHRLPPNITWRWLGPLSPDQALSRLEQADVLAAPSHSENFGHAIAEALARGLPVVVGTETPWADVAYHGAGWSVVSTDDSQLRAALEAACSLSGAAFAAMVDNAYQFAAQRAAPANAAQRLNEEVRAIMSGTAPGATTSR